jgi:hypothetical protein
LIALAALVNTGSPSSNLSHVAEAHAIIKVGGDTLENVPLWNGKALSTNNDIHLIPEAATNSPRSANDPARQAINKKQIIAQLAVSTSGVKQAVQTYFADIPIMVRIAECESQFRQIDAETEEVLRGRVNSADRGVMQINEMYHGETARKLGLNLLTLEGNMAYARHLYEEQGTRPWSSSAACWSVPAVIQIAKS